MRTNVQFTKDGINYKRTANVLSSRMTDTSLGLDAIRTNKKMSKYYWTLCFIVIAALLFFLKYAGFLISLIFIFFAGIIIHKSKVLKVKYTFDEDTALAWEHFLQETYSLCSSTTLWMEIGTRTNINVKYSAGASHTVDRTCINAGIINANRNTLVDYCIKFNSRTLLIECPPYPHYLFLFTPDGILCQHNPVLTPSPTVYAYDEIDLCSSIIRFVEPGLPASDAEIVDYTWQYINFNGTPDGRFKDNYRLPICLYGQLSVSYDDKSFVFQTSGKYVAEKIVNAYRNYQKSLLQIPR